MRQLPLVKSWSPMWQNISIKFQLHGAKWTEHIQEIGLELSDLNMRILIRGQLWDLGRFWIWVHPRKWIRISIHYGFTPSLTHLLIPCMIWLLLLDVHNIQMLFLQWLSQPHELKNLRICSWIERHYLDQHWVLKIWRFNVFMLSLQFPATGKVLASELPKCGNKTCSVLYPASMKAGKEIGMCTACAWRVTLLYLLLLHDDLFTWVWYLNLFFYIVVILWLKCKHWQWELLKIIAKIWSVGNESCLKLSTIVDEGFELTCATSVAGCTSGFWCPSFYLFHYQPVWFGLCLGWLK